MRTDTDRVQAAVRALADAVPGIPPPAAAVRARAEARPHRRSGHWPAPVLVAAAILALLAVVFVVPAVLRPGTTGDPGGPGDRPVLPERFAGLSPRTAEYRESPPGAAIALYHQGSLEPAGRDNSQQLVLGVDGRSYRQLEWLSSEGADAEQPWNALGVVLLSPDGSLLALPGGLGPERFAIIDLNTGMLERYQDVSGEPLAWSPDGRRLAVEWSGPNIDLDRPVVQVLDLATGAVDLIALDNAAGTGQVPVAAAFSPSGGELAIHTVREGEPGGTVSIVDRAGNLRHTIPLSEWQALATGGAAWSPDGTQLVVIEASGDALAFLDATGSAHQMPAPIRVGKDEVVLLGWRSADTMLVGWDDGSSRGTNLIAEVPLDGGAPRTVSQLSLGESGWVTGLQLATGLVAEAEIRDAGPHMRGPWEWPLRVALALAAALLLLVALAAAWRLVRRRAARPGAT